MSNNTDKYELGILESQFRIAFDSQIADVGDNFGNRHGWLSVSDKSNWPSLTSDEINSRFLEFRDARARYFAGRTWKTESDIGYSWEIVERGGSLLVRELIGGSGRRYEPATTEDLRLALSQLALLRPEAE